MVAPASTKPSAAKEPATKLGQFYRAHRPEVLAGGGVVVALLAWWKTKHPSSSSSASSTIDPATGDPTGSAADQAALAAQQAAASGSTPYSVTPGGGDGSTGYSGGGYSGDGGSGSDVLTALQGIDTTLTADQTLLQGLTPAPGNPTPTSPTASSKRTAAQAEAITEANLKNDQAALKANPSAKNKAAVKNLTTRLGKEKG